MQHEHNGTFVNCIGTTTEQVSPALAETHRKLNEVQVTQINSDEASMKEMVQQKMKARQRHDDLAVTWMFSHLVARQSVKPTVM